MLFDKVSFVNTDSFTESIFYSIYLQYNIQYIDHSTFFRVIPCKWLQKMPNRLSWIIFKKYRITIETIKMSRISLNFSFLCLKLQNKQVKGVKRNYDYRQRVSLLCCGIQTGRWNYFSLKYFELIARSRISISKFKE